MHRKSSDGALRFWEFTLLDMLAMQLSFLLSHSILGHEGFLYANPACRMQAMIFFSAQMALGLHSDSYDHIFTRDSFAELVKLLVNVVEIWLLGGVFILLNQLPFSLKETAFVSVTYLNLAFLLRVWNKKRRLRGGLPVRKTVLILPREQVEPTLRKFRRAASDVNYLVDGLLILDGGTEGLEELQMPVYDAYAPNLLDEIAHWWIDDVFLLLDENTPYPRRLAESFLLMGITVHTSLSVLDELPYSTTDVQDLGEYKVLTNSIKFVSTRASFIKRLIDILAGLAGVAVTGVIFLFVAPAIYLKSPGPIFFAQNRIGQNGRIFKMYKFRSMYMDAEKRKQELMEKNKIQGGLMFKMDDDPRIIGSEKKGRDGKPKGIGNFIRNTSLDEFPQFFNVLKGDMSLIGTRPPTVDEWNRYDPQHRIRMSAKPGITGMWQVSGRSKITDFEEVVALDRYYIEHWSLWLDLKILLKTVMVVLRHEGAS